MSKRKQILYGFAISFAMFFTVALFINVSNMTHNYAANSSNTTLRNGDSAVTISEDDYDYKSKVVKVVDGDTIYLENSIKIRLSIADTPERGKTGFKEATAFTHEKCFGKDAYIDVDDKQPLDRYKRTVALVYCGDGNANNMSINEELIKSGHARIYWDYCSKTEFTKLCYK
jgi:micrococcal nuclease